MALALVNIWPPCYLNSLVGGIQVPNFQLIEVRCFGGLNRNNPIFRPKFLSETLALPQKVLLHRSVGEDDVDGEDDRAKGQLGRQEVEEPGLAAAVAGHQAGKDGDRQEDAGPEADDGLLVDADSGRRRRRCRRRRRLKDDADDQLLTPEPVADVAGVDLDREVDQDGCQDEQPVQDFADQVDVVLKSRTKM